MPSSLVRTVKAQVVCWTNRLQRVFGLLAIFNVTTRKSERARNKRLGEFSLFRQHVSVLDQHERDALDWPFFLAGHVRIVRASPRGAPAPRRSAGRHSLLREAK